MLSIMGKRNMKAKPKFDATLDGEDLELVADMMDESDLIEAKKALNKYHHRVQEEKSKLEQLAQQSKHKGRAPRKVPAHEHETLERARKLIPQVANCTLCLEARWHLRWRAQYPREFPPYSMSRSFAEGDLAAKRRALFEVLAWLWAEHQRATGESCPWALSEKL